MLQAVKSKISVLLSPVFEGAESRPPQRKRSLDKEDCLLTPPDKRKKLQQSQNQSSFRFLKKVNTSFGDFFNYVRFGKNDKVSVFSDKAPMSTTTVTSHIKYRKTLKPVRKINSRLPQISSAAIVDLTNIDDTEDFTNDQECKAGFLNSTSALKEKSSSNVKSTSKCILRQKSTGYLDENVRLDEKRRYKELVAQFTTISESIFPSNGSSQTKASAPDIVDTLSSHSWLREKKVSSILIDLTRQENSEKIERKFYHERLHHSRSSSSVLEYSKLDESDFHDSRLTCSLQAKNEPLIGSDWIKKWRHTLDPTQLERERRISEEEGKVKFLQQKKKKNFEKLLKEIEESKPQLPTLTSDILAKIKQALQPGNSNDVLVQGFNAEITRADIFTLREATWLNDEVVNFYFNLLKERGVSCDNYPKVHVFNTFFYPKILKSGHSGVKRWTRKVDVFSHEMILIPIHLGMHWCLAVVDFQRKQILYYDSLKGNNTQCLEALRKYLQDESLDKKKVNFDFSDWDFLLPKDIPEQMNGCDCGVFMCKYAEYKSRKAPFTFTQADMSYFRKRMIYEIIHKKLM